MQHETVLAARTRLFRTSGFPADGGYDDPWAEAAFGVLRYRVPNGPQRAAALRLHDLHHLATGYDTDWRGESEISAWELAAGGAKTTAYAWLIASWGVFVGLVLHPGPTLRAFARGRGSRNLYGLRFEPRWLTLSVDQLKRELRVQPEREPTAGDVLAFAPWALASLALGAASLLPAMVLVGLASARQLFPCQLGCAGAR